MKKYNIGYTAGVYDILHIGHLTLLKEAKQQCEHLIVGINSDQLTESYKGKTPVVPESERMEIIKSIKYVDEVVLIEARDKIKAWEKIKFDVIFVGGDWKGSSHYKEAEEELGKKGVDFIYMPFVEGRSSTIIKNIIKEKGSKKNNWRIL